MAPMVGEKISDAGKNVVLGLADVLKRPCRGDIWQARPLAHSFGPYVARRRLAFVLVRLFVSARSSALLGHTSATVRLARAR